MKILAVGAHPDDVEFGCAPLLIQEASRGHHVHILVASKGEAASSGTPEEREQEARDAARLMNAASINFLDLGGDCHISYSPATNLLMARQIRSFQPQIVLAPLTEENQHPDHSAIGKAVRDGARLARYGGLEELRDLAPHAISSLFYYGITQSFSAPPQVLIDVTKVHAKWVAAMECHKSQMATRSYVDLVNARARTAGAALGVEYAVPLWSSDPLAAPFLTSLPFSARYF